MSKEKEIEFIAPLFQTYDVKPKGLWYAIGYESIEWCKNEMPEWIEPYLHEIIVDESKILIISNIRQFEEFEDKFGRVVKPFDFNYIDWIKVSEKYSGIEINPYLWAKRLHSKSIWYYGWDIASGCIWKSDAIIDIKFYKKIDHCFLDIKHEK